MSRMTVFAGLLAALLAVGSGSPALSEGPAADFYLKIEGVEGEASDGAIALAGIAWNTIADVGQFAADPPAELAARYGGAQFAGGGMSSMREATAPRDRPSGLASGRRQHKPLTVVREVDKATPKILMIVTDGNPFDVEVWERDEAGASHLRYTLKEAIITSFAVSRGADGASAPMESISFAFERMEFPN